MLMLILLTVTIMISMTMTLMLSMMMTMTNPSHVGSFQELLGGDGYVVEETEAHCLKCDEGEGDDIDEDGEVELVHQKDDFLTSSASAWWPGGRTRAKPFESCKFEI